MDELLSLKWNNHNVSFIGMLSQLRNKDVYTDVTLACEGKLYNVHKFILSMCSDYFSTIFQTIENKNPVIILKDVKCKELEALLDYMYLGEVNVSQIDLAPLIKTAECLQLKGLAVPDENDKRKAEPTHTPARKKKLKLQNNEDINDENILVYDDTYIENKVTKNEEIVVKGESPECELVEPVKEEFNSIDFIPVTTDMTTDQNTMDDSNSGNFEMEPVSDHWLDIQPEANECLSPYSLNPGDTLEMPTGSGQQNELPHSILEVVNRKIAKTMMTLPQKGKGIKRHMVRTPRECVVCGKFFSDFAALRRHQRSHTGEKPFGCPHCQYWFSQKTSVQKHKRLLHKDVSNMDNIKVKN